MYQLAAFSADVTVPLGHRLMGILPTKAQRIDDPLYAHGFVLIGAGKPIVLCAVDWCEIRNEAYERWRKALAAATQTEPNRVIVCSLHQHDAPVVDLGAENFLARAGLSGEMFDYEFHEKCVERVAAALRDAVPEARRITHIGTGQAKVERIASNRRVVLPDRRVTFSRGSASGGRDEFAGADEGLIDPFLKTLSFWDGEEPVLALHVYATHPMSYYGRGGVSADFVGLARDRRQRNLPRVPQIYASGCSGDVTAGKYNDGSPENRPALADRLYQAMKKSWEATRRHPLEAVNFRVTPLELPFRDEPGYQTTALIQTLENAQADVRQRILAAMALSSRQRVSAGLKIDFPCVDFGPAQIVLFPGEAFVGYQLLAQEMRPDSFVLSIGYGECWPGYIPTEAAFGDSFNDTWLWVSRGCEERIKGALARVLPADS